jgi:hypothetical protein
LDDITGNEKSDPEDKPKAAAPPIAATEKQNPQTAKQAANSGQANGSQHRLLDLVAIVIAVFAFSAAAWQGWVARDTEKRSLRAYVGTADIKITENPSQITLGVENHGQTPARHVKVFSSWHVVQKGQSLPKDFSFPDLDECPDSLKSETALYPKVPLPAVTETGNCPLVLGKMALAVSGHSTLYLYGHVDYEDVFDNPHTTTFCLTWASGTSSYCDRHNEIDPQH